MPSSQDFKPDWVSAPGETISEILRERHLTAVAFADQLGQPIEDTLALLQGRATISLGVARSLQRTLGASVEFWMARDFQYREDVSRRDSANEAWLTELPLRDMIKFGWLRPIPHPFDEFQSCLRFFDVASLTGWREKYADLHSLAAFRKSSAYESRPAATAAWIRQGEIEADRISCDPWNADRLRAAIPYLRTLTRQKNPAVFLPKTVAAAAQCGVAVAIVRAPNGCRASGATRFISREKALLLLSFRHLTDDHFWFSFFHEVGHLLLHGQERLFLEGDDTPISREEDVANEYASLVLVPADFQEELHALKSDVREVIAFARRVGVSPGIIVGQLQHIRSIRYNQLTGLKRRYRWSK